MCFSYPVLNAQKSLRNNKRNDRSPEFDKKSVSTQKRNNIDNITIVTPEWGQRGNIKKKINDLYWFVNENNQILILVKHQRLLHI